MASAVRVPIDRLLAELKIRAKREGRLWRAKCPAHDDHDPSWTIVDDGGDRHGSHHCPSCGFGGGPWELAATVLDLPIAEAGKWVWATVVGGSERDAELSDVPIVRVVVPPPMPSEMSIPNGVKIPTLDGSEWHPRALGYLHDRRIPDWQIERWSIGYATIGRCAWRVFVPVYTRGRLLSFVARAFLNDGRKRYLAAERKDRGARPSAALWGEPAFDREVRVATVTEGVFKALAMERARSPNPCAVLGASNLGVEKIEILTDFDALLIATDPDKAGEKSYSDIADATCRYAEPIRVNLELAPDDASDEQNEKAWREALARALPGLRARRATRVA